MDTNRYSIKIFALVAVLVFSSGLNAGQPGYEFLRTHVGARPAALGGAFAAVTGDVHSVYYNPAALSTLPRRQLTFSYLNYFLDFQSGFLAYGYSLGRWGSQAVAVHYLNYGTFDRTDQLGNKLGTFGADSYVVQLASAYPLSENFSVGLGLKFIHGKIAEYNSSAWAVDFGLLYSVPSQALNVGFAVLNSGSVIDPYAKTVDSLPVSYRLGIGKRLAHLPLLLLVEGYLYRGEDAQFVIGGEFTLTPYWLLRVSYNSIGRQQHIGQVGDKYAGLSVGTGVRIEKGLAPRHFFWKNLNLDYSFTSAGHVGTLNRLSLRFDF